MSYNYLHFFADVPVILLGKSSRHGEEFVVRGCSNQQRKGSISFVLDSHHYKNLRNEDGGVTYSEKSRVVSKNK